MKVLIPIDGSEQALKTITKAGKFLDKQVSRIYLLTVMIPMAESLPWGNWEDVLQSKKDLNQARCQADIAGLKVESTAHVILGTPAFAICDHANKINANLIVIGTHGYQGNATFILGSVAQQVLESAIAPVILVRNNEHDISKVDCFEKLTSAF